MLGGFRSRYSVAYAHNPASCFQNSNIDSFGCLVKSSALLYKKQVIEVSKPISYYLYTNVASLHGTGLFQDLSRLYEDQSSHIGYWIWIYFYPLFSAARKLVTLRVSRRQNSFSRGRQQKCSTNFINEYYTHTIWKCCLHDYVLGTDYFSLKAVNCNRHFSCTLAVYAVLADRCGLLRATFHSKESPCTR